jgi:hypothetical protein
MGVLPCVLGSHTLRRTFQVRLGCEPLRLPGVTPIFTVSPQRIVNKAGYAIKVKQPTIATNSKKRSLAASCTLSAARCLGAFSSQSVFFLQILFLRL